MAEKGETSRKALLEVLRGQRPWRRPVWLMRQAGRYMPEYRQVRSEAGSFLNLCGMPELAAEVTLQPLRRYDLDAAIVFADILLVPWAMGAELDYRENEGPVLSRVGGAGDLRRLSGPLRDERLTPVYETLRVLRSKLAPHVTLIGFCGAPWTVASYLIEGGSSNGREHARRVAFERRPWFDELIERLVDVSVGYLLRQAEAGAEVLQIFDSWAGDLDDGLRETYCFRPIRAILDRLRLASCDIPVIGFARGIGAGHLRFAETTGVSAVGVESSAPVSWMACELARATPVQGNLDPLLLSLGGQPLEAAVRHIVETMPIERHIFNLGHGIRQDTPPEHVSDLLRTIRSLDG